MEPSRYFIHLAFDGTGYHGWQRQPNAPTVQQTLEEAFSLLLHEPLALTGAGRTDAGVHADDFYAHFDCSRVLGAEERKNLVFRLNRYLCNAIAIREIIPVGSQSHARFSAVSRTYRYCIAREKSPFRRDFTHYMYGAIDSELMNRGAALIMSYRDFTSFSKVDTDTKTNNCCITAAQWTEEGDELVFRITADRFLRNMVRAVVGTLLELGTGKITLPELQQIIENHNRSDAGDSVPARGLSLVKIVYPEGTFLASDQ